MPKMVWIWQGALHACFFFGGFFCFFGDRVRVHVAAHAGGGETDLATRGARCT